MAWVELILDFVIGVVEAGAWPAVVVFAAIKLRKEFSSLIRGLLAGRMTRAETPVGTYEFAPPLQVQDAEAETEDAAEAAERALPAAVANEHVRGIIENAQQRTNIPEEVNELLALQLFYERVYRYIYRSQMEFLKYLEATEAPANPLEVGYHHGLHAERAGEHALDQETWLDYLHNAGFIESVGEGDRIAITQTGLWYLAYCNAVGYTISNRLL